MSQIRSIAKDCSDVHTYHIYRDLLSILNRKVDLIPSAETCEVLLQAAKEDLSVPVFI